MHGQNDHPRASRMLKWLPCAVLVVAGFLLLSDHQAHVFSVLPYLLLAACPLMHLFMHRGHGHHHRLHPNALPTPPDRESVSDDSRRAGGSGSY